MQKKKKIPLHFFSHWHNQTQKIHWDQPLSLLLRDCKEPFIASDLQMKPEDANKDPDCAARHAPGCHRARHIRLRPGNNQALQAASKKSSCNKDAFYSSFLRKLQE